MCCSPWGHKKSDTTEQLNWLNWLRCPTIGAERQVGGPDQGINQVLPLASPRSAGGFDPGSFWITFSAPCSGTCELFSWALWEWNLYFPQFGRSSNDLTWNYHLIQQCHTRYISKWNEMYAYTVTYKQIFIAAFINSIASKWKQSKCL